MPIRNDKIFDPSPPSDWRISIGGTNITALVTRLELSKPIPSQRTPQLISGSIELVQPINVAVGRRSGVYAPALASYSIDPDENSDLRAYGQLVTIFGEGRTIAALRLIEDVYFDFNTGTGQGILGHLILSVADQEGSAVDVETNAVSNVYDISQNLSTDILPIGLYAQRLLGQATDSNGTKSFTESDLDVSSLPTQLSNTYTATGVLQTLGYEASQNFDGALDSVLHGIFFENTSRALEPVSGTERLRASDRYPLSQGSLPVRLALPWTQTIITPQDISIESEITSVKVSSGGGGITRILRRAADEYPYEVVTARFADGSPAETTFIDQPIDSSGRLVTTYRRETSINWLTGSGSGNITRREEKTETFGNQGEPIRREQQFTITRHELGKLPVPGLGRYQQEGKDTGNVSLTSGLEIITEWDYDSAINLTSISTTYRIGAQYAFEGAAGDGLVTVLREEEVYQNTLNSTINPKWETFTTRMIAQGLIDDTQATTLVADPDFYSEHRPIDGVPRPEYREPTKPITIQRFASSRSDVNIAGAGSPSTLTAQATYAASSEGGAQLAQTLLAMNAQLRAVWDVQMALPSGFDLFGSWDIYHIDNGKEAYAIALVGPYLLYENNVQTQTLIYGGTAAQLGGLPNRIPPVNRPVSPLRYIAPSPTVPNPEVPLSINAIGDVTAFQGIEVISIALAAYGGTSPYIFSALGLPAGLSIAGDEIVGTPTAATAAVTVTVTAEDATTATVSIDFLIEVVAEDAPAPVYQFDNSVYVFSASTVEMSILELPSVVAIGGMLAGGGSALQVFLAQTSGGMLAGGSGEGKGAIAAASGGMLAGGVNELLPIVAEASGGASFGGVSEAETPRLTIAAAATATALGITLQEVLDELNLLWWFDYSDETNLTKVGGGPISIGDEIETMSSSTTTANTFTFNAGSRATKTADGILLNGSRYQGSATKGTTVTMFLVGKTTATTADQRLLAVANPGFEAPDSVSQFILTRIQSREPQITLNSAIGTTLPDGTLSGSALDTNDHILTFDINTTNYVIRVDGVEDARFDGIDTTVEFDPPVTITTAGLFAGGRTPGDSNNAVEGEYRGFLYGNFDVDVAIIERFLSEYYNIALS